MRILGIETATSVCAVGIAQGSDLIAEYRLNHPRSHAEVLPDAVKRVMADSGVTRETLDGIAVSTGPGSFTGLRIGLGFAKGLAMGWDLPLIPVPTMAGIMARIPPLTGNASVLIIARRNEVYEGRYSIENGRWEPSGKIETVASQDIGKKGSGERLFAGDGALAYRDAIAAGCRRARFVPESLSLPDGYGIAVEGGRILSAGSLPDADSVVPCYIKRFQGIA